MTLPALLRRWVPTLGLIFGGVFIVAAPSEAGILDASWIAPTTNTDGSQLTDMAAYRVYYGPATAPCPNTTYFQVASPTSSPAPNTTVTYRLTGLTPGTLYYVSVTAVDTTGNESACSLAASAVAQVDFSVTPTGSTSYGNVNIASSADRTFTVQNTRGGLVAGVVTTSAPFTVLSGTPFTLNGLGASQAVTVRFTPTTTATSSVNVNFTADGDTISRLVTGTGTGTDTVAPTVAITSPTAGATYSTSTTPLTLGGTALDNVAVTQVTWSNNRGGSGTASGTASWTASGIALQPGSNVLTVTARDSAGNTGTATLTVTLTDTTGPGVAITSPTPSATYSANSSPLTLGGTASDNVAVTQVTWANNRGGSGTATGTTSWSASGIALLSGSNVLTVTARDAAANTKTATLTVTYDPTAPSVSISAPAAGTTVTGTTTVSATASDNIGVVGVQFLLDGASLGSEQPGPTFSISWNTATAANGAHTLSARARDAAGNTTVSARVGVTVSNTQAAGLVAAYSFDQGSGSTVTDASGNNNTGTITGATWTTAGRFGGALTFNGTSAMVTVPNAASLQLTTGMTLEAWVNPSVVASAWRDAIYKGNDNYYLSASSSSSGKPAVGGTFAASSSATFGAAALAANTWTHLAATYDGATLRLYVNAVQVSSMARTGNLAMSTNPLQIGGDSLFGQFFQGQIDDVRVYNRALSVSEIQTDMGRPVGSASFTFTNDPLAAQRTVVQALHITELRSAINTVRAARGLSAFTWTDPTLTAGSTKAKALHLTEMRTALNQAYQAVGRTAPTYTDATVTVIKAIHLNELRTAVRGL